MAHGIEEARNPLFIKASGKGTVQGGSRTVSPDGSERQAGDKNPSKLPPLGAREVVNLRKFEKSLDPPPAQRGPNAAAECDRRRRKHLAGVERQ